MGALKKSRITIITLESLLFIIVEYALLFATYNHIHQPLGLLLFPTIIAVFQKHLSFLQTKLQSRLLCSCIVFLSFVLSLLAFYFKIKQ